VFRICWYLNLSGLTKNYRANWLLSNGSKYVNSHFTNAKLGTHKIHHPQRLPTVALQVRNKWLRLLETIGGRGASMTGAPVQSANSADSRPSNQQQQGGSQSGSGACGRGRGGVQNRGGNSRGGRGGSRVVPRPVIPPASVSHHSFIFYYSVIN
jgi:hypothetical protein